MLTISISIEKKLLEDIDKLRGLAPRSTYISHLLRHCVENIQNHKETKEEQTDDFR
jgi:metal-responsive CopG/Arc/MetJ family transcriptional regulator